MPIITPDFSEAPESEAVPAGVYSARITECTQKLSKAGNAYLNWKLTIFGAEGELARQNNRPVFMMTMLDGKGAGRLKELARAALGRVPAAGEPLDTDEFLGKEIEVAVADRLKEDGTPSPFPDVRSVRALRPDVPF